MNRLGKIVFASLTLGGAAAAGSGSFALFAKSRADAGEDVVDFSKNHIKSPDRPPMGKWDENWDKRDPRFMKKKVWAQSQSPTSIKQRDGLFSPSSSHDEKTQIVYPTARRHLYLIRHGQYHDEVGAEDEDEGHILTKLGTEQAALTGGRLGSSGIKFTSITSSGLKRAVETGEIILKEMKMRGKCEELSLVVDPMLNEGAPCVPEPPYKRKELWDPEFHEFHAEGARIEAAFRKYFHRAHLNQKEDSYEIIVCHANVIRYFTLRALQFPPEGWLRIGLDHGSVTRISLLPDGDVVLRGLGDSGHFPPEKTT